MPNYAESKIYRIVSNSTGKNYVGCTVVSLSQRLSQHVKDYRNWIKATPEHIYKPYCTSYEILKTGDYQIVLIEKFPCKNREQLLCRERFYINSIECVNWHSKIKCKKPAIENAQSVLLTAREITSIPLPYKPTFSLTRLGPPCQNPSLSRTVFKRPEN
jgi:hypothetical protein